MEDSHGRKGQTAELIAVWALVGIPLIWGVTMTCIKAAALFK